MKASHIWRGLGLDNRAKTASSAWQAGASAGVEGIQLKIGTEGRNAAANTAGAGGRQEGRRRGGA